MNIKCNYPNERQQLLLMMRNDTDARKKIKNFDPKEILGMNKIDTDNQKKLKKILNIIDTPNVENIGHDGAEAVWLIAQHSSNDVFLLKDVLDRMIEATKNSKNDGYYQGIPFLIDRICVIEGKKQIYGTQFFGNGKNAKPFPVNNPENIDTLRAEYDLIPYEEYKTSMKLEIS